jgi:DNA invertase Pin-like site-specific DNA recombinase
MSYSVTINAALGSTALDSSALGNFGVSITFAAQPGSPPPAAPVEPVVAPQIQKIRSRRGQEEERKRELLGKVPRTWIQEQRLPAESQPVEATGPEDAAIYRRVSTPEQKDSSMDRQGGVESYAKLINVNIAFVYDDKGKSGRFKAGRPQLLRMMDDAKAGKFKKLILETGNRLARDLGLTTSVFRDLRRWGVEIHTPAEGKWHLLHAAFNGVMGQEALENLKMWTRAGMERSVLDGKFPGTAPYGFDKKPGYPGELYENTDESPHVRWIYSLRGAGIPPAEIRRLLNAKKIPSPKGVKWSTVQVCSILRNPIYIGLLIYFRTKSEKSETDAYKIIRKVSKTPMSQWRVSERPDWEIVKVDVWNKVQQLDASRQTRRTRPAKRLLSGILSCGYCGSPVHSHARSWEHVRIYCSDYNRRREEANSKPEGKACHSRATVLMQCVEIVTVEAAAERIGAVGAAVVAEKAYKSGAAREIAETEKERRGLEAQIKDILGRIKGTFEAAYTQGMGERAIASLRQDLNEDLEAKELELAALPVVTIPEKPLENLNFGELGAFLQDFPYCKDFDESDEHGSRMVAAFQELVSTIEVEALSARSFNLTIRGPLAHIGCRPDDPDPVIRIEARDVELKVPKGPSESAKRRWNYIPIADIRINDDEWALMAPFLPREPVWVEGHPKPIGSGRSWNCCCSSNAPTSSSAI